jgi:hypothetical protein
VSGKIQYLGSGHIHMTPNEKCLYISERTNSTPAKEVPEEIADRTIPSLPRGCTPPVGGAAPDDAY